jgi:hypothetical protein
MVEEIPEGVLDPVDFLIQQWIMSVTGYDNQHVIRANQVGKRPNYNYATYYNVGGVESDYAVKKKVDEIDEVPIPDDNIEATYTTADMILYDISVYALDGARHLKNLFKSRNLLSARQILRLGNLVIGDRSDVIGPTEFGDTKYRPRYQSTFQMRTMSDMKETYQKILEIQLTGKCGDLDVIIDA